MMLPGFGGDRIPMRMKLYIAIGVSAPIAAQLWSTLEAAISAKPLFTITILSTMETITGALIGLTCRMFLFAAETMLTAVTMSIGLGNALGAPINESEPTPAIASLLLLGATTLIFVLDLHLDLIRGMSQSYDAVPPFDAASPQDMLREMLKSLDQAYLIVFRISSPFLIFGLITNVAVAFLNKMTPQVPVYFVSTPALIFFGVGFLYLLSPEALAELSLEYAAWLRKG